MRVFKFAMAAMAIMFQLSYNVHACPVDSYLNVTRGPIHQLTSVLKMLPSRFMDKFVEKEPESLQDWVDLLSRFDLETSSLASKTKEKSILLKKIMYLVSLGYSQFNCNLNPKTKDKWDWWNKITDGIYLGAIPLKKHLQGLKQENIRSVLSLVEPFERRKSAVAHPLTHKRLQQEGIDNFVLGIPDFAPVGIDKIHEGVGYLYQTQDQGKNVYVHCKAGRGRSAIVVAAYLALKKGLESIDEAESLVKKSRPRIKIDNKKERAAVYLNLIKALDEDNPQREVHEGRLINWIRHRLEGAAKWSNGMESR